MMSRRTDEWSPTEGRVTEQGEGHVGILEAANILFLGPVSGQMVILNYSLIYKYRQHALYRCTFHDTKLQAP